MTIRALIAEDEPLSRRRLQRLLDRFEDIEVVEVTADGAATIEAIDRLRPDLVFLDIRLPGPSGLQVLDEVMHRPHVIFTTAYDRYAVTAFELQALDYLVKPFGAGRLTAAIERARTALRCRHPTESGRAAAAIDPSPALERLFVRTRGRITQLSTGAIEHLEAQGDYLRIHSGGRGHLIHVRLNDLAARLDSGRFVRVHRSHIVNLDYVRNMRRHAGSRYLITLRSGTQVIASRERSRHLRRLIASPRR
jgi:two-component system LytT family response regulator